MGSFFSAKKVVAPEPKNYFTQRELELQKARDEYERAQTYWSDIDALKGERYGGNLNLDSSGYTSGIEGIANDYMSSVRQRGTPGEFGESADYYRGVLGAPDSAFRAYGDQAWGDYADSLAATSEEALARRAGNVQDTANRLGSVYGSNMSEGIGEATRAARGDLMRALAGERLSEDKAALERKYGIQGGAAAGLGELGAKQAYSNTINDQAIMGLLGMLGDTSQFKYGIDEANLNRDYADWQSNFAREMGIDQMLATMPLSQAQEQLRSTGGTLAQQAAPQYAPSGFSQLLGSVLPALAIGLATGGFGGLLGGGGGAGGVAMRASAV